MSQPDNSTRKAPLPSGDWTDVLSDRIINQFVGKHIAIVHKQVIASADSYEAVVREAHLLFPDETPFITFIPFRQIQKPMSGDTEEDTNTDA